MTSAYISNILESNIHFTLWLVEGYCLNNMLLFSNKVLKWNFTTKVKWSLLLKLLKHDSLKKDLSTYKCVHGVECVLENRKGELDKDVNDEIDDVNFVSSHVHHKMLQ